MMRKLKNYMKSKLPFVYKTFIIHKMWNEKRKNRYLENLKSEDYPKVLAKMYKKRTGRKLNLLSPTTYTEKMQYAKLNQSNELKTRLTDKYLVREWVKETIGEDYLIPLLGVWDRFNDIDFSLLPEKFVLKANHGSGWNVVVKDKNTFDKDIAKIKFDNWIERNYTFSSSLEMQYKDIKPKIIAEKYMESSRGELEDYKFLCFNGEVKYCWVDVGRFSQHRRNVYDLNWNLQKWNQGPYINTNYEVPKPKNFDKMVSLVEKLCKGFSHVRVDLYHVNGKIYFGEMTFTNGSGFELIKPEKYNIMLGEMWELTIDKR